MKRFLALLLVLILALSMIACDSSGDSEQGQQGNDDNSDVSDPDKGGSKATAYKTFDDLGYEWDVKSDLLLWIDSAPEGAELYLSCDTPKGYNIDPLYGGFAVYDATHGPIIVAAGEYTPGITLEDAFFPANENYFTDTLNDFKRHTDWLEFTASSKEDVTINGRAAIKFTGVQNAEDYSSPYTYDVYGYCVVIENVPVIIAAVSGDRSDLRSDDNMEMSKHFVDEMIYTLRALDHYEPYGSNKE